MASPRPPQQYLPNGGFVAPGAGQSSNNGFLPNNGRVMQAGGARVLCIADVRGNLRSLNDLARQARADYVIHTGDFGFYDENSIDGIADKTLKHVAQYSPLLSDNVKRVIQTSQPQQLNPRQRFPNGELTLSELPLLTSKKVNLEVPVYTVWGACEDVRVLEKFRAGEYKVHNLHIIDESSSRLLDVGGVKLRILGLGGAVVMHKLFDNGEGKTTIAGGQGTMWTTLLQMGELVDTANRVYDPAETRVFLTHASPAREGLLNQLSVTLKADFSVSAGLHFRYGSSYNEFSVNPTLDHYRGKLAASKASFNDVWETVKSEVEPVVASNGESQQQWLRNALEIIEKMPSVANGGNPFGGPVPGQNAQGAGGAVDESAFKNMWNFNLADAAYGYLVLEVDSGRIGTEMRAQGFNFAHRGLNAKQGAPTPAQTPAAQINNTPQTYANAGGPSGPGLNRHMPPNAHPQNQQGPPTQPSRGPPPFNQQQSHRQQSQQHVPPPQQPKSTPTAQAPAQATNNAPSNAAKPATPQAQTANTAKPAVPSNAPADKTQPPQNDNRNGATPTDRKEPPKPASPAVDKKPSTGLFLHNMESEQAVRALFSDDERWKIQKIEKHGKSNHVVHFASHEEAKAAFDRQPSEYKRNAPPAAAGEKRKPHIKWYSERNPASNVSQRDSPSNSGAGTWQASTRGGVQNGPRPGYQSGASDSEGGRGRGGFNGRGRGRGSERGGRGGRGGRGNFGNKSTGGEEGSSPAPPKDGPAASAAPAAPAAPATPAAS